VTVRAARPADLEFVRLLGAQVFAHFGDYGTIIPEWLTHEGLQTFIADDESERAGFTMIGFYRIPDEPGSGNAPPMPAYAADLLAIAVAPTAQRRGVGRALLEHAIATARAARRRLPVRELRLSVAETNLRARRMFAAAGFVEVPGEHGHYDRGQRALHMKRVL
jgi:ribosomal protein S18 acetylase RimI-like enzyme